MEQTTLAFARSCTNFFMAVLKRLASVRPDTAQNLLPDEGAGAFSCGRLGNCFFVDASQHPSTKLFPVWKTFSPRFEKVSTRNAFAKRLSSTERVTPRIWCTPKTFHHGVTEGIHFTRIRADDCESERNGNQGIRFFPRYSRELKLNCENQLASFILRVCLNAILPVRSS